MGSERILSPGELLLELALARGQCLVDVAPMLGGYAAAREFVAGNIRVDERLAKKLSAYALTAEEWLQREDDYRRNKVKADVELAKQIIKFLNELNAVDPDAVYALVTTRVACNEALTNHPTVQVDAEGNEASVGLLGVLNGLVGTNEAGWGLIVAQVCTSTRKIERFELSGSMEYEDCGQVRKPAPVKEGGGE